MSARIAILLAPLAVVLSGCGIFHVGHTSLAGTEVLAAAPKPAPVDSEFEGCGPAGSQPDYALNRLKNRVDDAPRYLAVPWTMIAELPWPRWAGYRFRNQWDRAEQRAVARYEGAAVEIEGFIVGYRLEVPEPPNCYAREERKKDFHLWLSREPNGTRRESIVVEFTPRVRVRHPGWTDERLFALRASQVRVRVRGWLMLDQMHPERVDRNRVTLWEVHPIMHLDWRTRDGSWVSLDSLAPPLPADHPVNAAGTEPDEP